MKYTATVLYNSQTGEFQKSLSRIIDAESVGEAMEEVINKAVRHGGGSIYVTGVVVMELKD